MIFLKNKILILSLIFITSCSSSYENLSKNRFVVHDKFSKYLLDAYKEKADFEAKQMHDWNSTKLYSEKALSAVEGGRVVPQEIGYWKIENNKKFDLVTSYNNLISIYKEAIEIDPYNLAKAISSLDCWAEQQEEGWQTWDINICRDDFLEAMHKIYNSIHEKNAVLSSDNATTTTIKESFNKNKASIVTKDQNKNLLQIIYFDFDRNDLSEVSKTEIKKFIRENKEKIKKYIIIGHTDTVGTDKYNMKLSLERAKSVESILLKLGIKKSDIKVLSRGEKDLRVKTKNEVSHPANRRAEISPLN